MALLVDCDWFVRKIFPSAGLFIVPTVIFGQSAGTESVCATELLMCRLVAPGEEAGSACGTTGKFAPSLTGEIVNENSSDPTSLLSTVFMPADRPTATVSPGA